MQKIVKEGNKFRLITTEAVVKSKISMKMTEDGKYSVMKDGKTMKVCDNEKEAKDTMSKMMEGQESLRLKLVKRGKTFELISTKEAVMPAPVKKTKMEPKEPNQIIGSSVYATDSAGMTRRGYVEASQEVPGGEMHYLVRHSDGTSGKYPESMLKYCHSQEAFAGVESGDFDATERSELNIIEVAEASGTSKGRVKIVLIEPGETVNGNKIYKPASLEQAAKEGIFNGAKMFINHPTKEEQIQRPERSVDDWIATVESTAMEDGKLVGTCAIHGSPTRPAESIKGWLKSVKEAGVKAALSIHAILRGSYGVVKGKKIPVIESFAKAHSVDFVTAGNAGGEVRMSTVEAIREENAVAMESSKPIRMKKKLVRTEKGFDLISAYEGGEGSGRYPKGSGDNPQSSGGGLKSIGAEIELSTKAPKLAGKKVKVVQVYPKKGVAGENLYKVIEQGSAIPHMVRERDIK